MRYASFCAIALSVVPQILAQPFSTAQNISTIQWTNCTTPIPGACGTLTVPLDYTNVSSGRTLNLSMSRIDATLKPSRGSILINQGGPGLDGASFLRRYGEMLQVMFGGHYDIIGFDPRGTGKTLLIDCIPNPMERIRQGLLVPFGTNVSDVALGHAWTWGKLYGDNCYENAKDVGELMGTAFVARDMMQIVDALGEDGLLRYFGQSYGTILGQTAAAMFPDRIDKMVIDGVLNPIEYTFGWEYDNIPVGELALEKFFEECLATKNQSACALYRPNATVASLTKKIHDLAEEVKFSPIVMGSNITTDIVDLAQIKVIIENPLRQMLQMGPTLAMHLDAIFERNTTTYKLTRPQIIFDNVVIPGSLLDGGQNIRCTDATYRTENFEEILPLVERATNISSLYGDGYPVVFIQCAQWKLHAKGRYEGNFKTKTKNPMLIIGSPYDIRSPFISAQKSHELFEGSALLQHNGLGHCVFYSPGQCAIKAMQDYFTNGTLPQPGTVCEQDFGIFSGKTLWDSYGLAPPAPRPQ